MKTSIEKDPAAAVAATRERILADGVIQCIRLDDGTRALEACRAAARGGLAILELTLTTPGALEHIRALTARDAGEQALLVGAGTVLDPGQVAAVAEAGGRFVMSPVFDPAVLDEAQRLGPAAFVIRIRCRKERS